MSIEYEMYLNEVAFARAEGGARTPGLSRLRSFGHPSRWATVQRSQHGAGQQHSSPNLIWGVLMILDLFSGGCGDQ
jgi:hypothetical protein